MSYSISPSATGTIFPDKVEMYVNFSFIFIFTESFLFRGTAFIKVSPLFVILLWVAAILNVVLAPLRVIPKENMLKNYQKFRVIICVILFKWITFLKSALSA